MWPLFIFLMLSVAVCLQFVDEKPNPSVKQKFLRFLLGFLVASTGATIVLSGIWFNWI